MVKVYWIIIPIAIGLCFGNPGHSAAVELLTKPVIVENAKKVAYIDGSYIDIINRASHELFRRKRTLSEFRVVMYESSTFILVVFSDKGNSEDDRGQNFGMPLIEVVFDPKTFEIIKAGEVYER